MMLIDAQSPFLALAIRFDSEDMREWWFEARAHRGEVERSHVEIARVLGVDVSRVGQIERAAIAKLKRRWLAAQLWRELEGAGQ